MIEELSKAYEEEGANGLLPHELPEDVFNYMIGNVDKFLNNEIEEESTEFSCIFFCVLMILEHQSGNKDQLEITPEDLMSAMRSYCVALGMEEANKKTGLEVTQPTLFDILDGKRKIGVGFKEDDEDEDEDDEDNLVTSVAIQLGRRHAGALMNRLLGL